MQDKLVQFSEMTHVPLVTSLLSMEAVPYSHPLRVGFIGSYGSRWGQYREVA